MGVDRLEVCQRTLWQTPRSDEPPAKTLNGSQEMVAGSGRKTIGAPLGQPLSDAIRVEFPETAESVADEEACSKPAYRQRNVLFSASSRGQVASKVVEVLAKRPFRRLGVAVNKPDRTAGDIAFELRGKLSRRLFVKPTYTKQDPETGRRVRRKATKWYIEFKDAAGVVRRVQGFRAGRSSGASRGHRHCLGAQRAGTRESKHWWVTPK